MSERPMLLLLAIFSYTMGAVAVLIGSSARGAIDGHQVIVVEFDYRSQPAGRFVGIEEI